MIGVFAVLIAIVFVRFIVSSRALREHLMRIVNDIGWEGTQRRWLNGALRGRWRGFEVELRHMDRYKGVPERLQLTINAQAPARVIMKRRVMGFLSRPMTLFGPPLVEPVNLQNRDQYWIRADEQVFAEMIFTHREIEPLLEPNLVARFDSIELGPRGLKMMRAVDDAAVKRRFGRPFFKWGRDLDLIETVAREEWTMASTLAGALGLPPRK